MTIRERLATELSSLSDEDLGRVEGFVSFLQAKRGAGLIGPFDEARLKVLYTDAEGEDRSIAQEGMTDYAAGLRKEDSA